MFHSVQTNQGEIETLAADFFTSMFTTQDITIPDVVVQYVPSKVTETMTDRLCEPFSEEEVQKALFMMGPNKSPGRDGFTAGFYQKH